jgi:hypothetical protein
LIASFHCCLPKTRLKHQPIHRKLRQDFHHVLGTNSDHHSQGGGGTDTSRAAELKSHRL